MLIDSVALEDRAPALPYLSDCAQIATADGLIRDHGDDAAHVAAAEADRSRDKGNALHFARWRQIERLILILQSPTRIGTLQ
jgi:hypothetical protein